MPFYSLDFSVTTGTTGGTYKTAGALIAADTIGHRARLLRLFVGPKSANPPDENLLVKVCRILDVSAGTAGTKTAVAGSAMNKKDPGSVDSLISGGVDYTVEPTAYEARAQFQGAVNMRSWLVRAWSEKEAPAITPDMLLGVLLAPADTLGAGLEVVGTLDFETY